MSLRELSSAQPKLDQSVACGCLPKRHLFPVAFTRLRRTHTDHYNTPDAFACAAGNGPSPTSSAPSLNQTFPPARALSRARPACPPSPRPRNPSSTTRSLSAARSRWRTARRTEAAPGGARARAISTRQAGGAPSRILTIRRSSSRSMTTRMFCRGIRIFTETETGNVPMLVLVLALLARVWGRRWRRLDRRIEKAERAILFRSSLGCRCLIVRLSKIRCSHLLARMLVMTSRVRFNGILLLGECVRMSRSMCSRLMTFPVSDIFALVLRCSATISVPCFHRSKSTPCTSLYRINMLLRFAYTHCLSLYHAGVMTSYYQSRVRCDNCWRSVDTGSGPSFGALCPAAESNARVGKAQG